MSDPVTAEFVLQLARYGNLPLDDERAAVLARTLAPALARLHAIKVENYDALLPANTFRIPPRP